MIRLLTPLFLLLSLPLPVTAGPAPVHDPLMAELNRHRQQRGIRPLAWNEELARVARGRAQHLAVRGSISDPDMAKLMERLAARGYPVRSLEEASLLFSGAGSSSGIVEQWRRLGADSFQRFLTHEVSELGVGVAQRGKVVVYTLLTAAPAQPGSGPPVARLDLEDLRGRMLAQVNHARHRQGRTPLSRHPLLDRAAQARADDMAARRYYAHRTPEGLPFTIALERTGYLAQAVAENIARGQRTLEAVMRGWLDSPGHRRNLLDPAVTEAGFGVAWRRTASGEEPVWVQLLARPALR